MVNQKKTIVVGSEEELVLSIRLSVTVYKIFVCVAHFMVLKVVCYKY